MRSRSAPGSSTPTSRPTDRRRQFLPILAAVALVPIGAVYVIVAFTAPDPLLRIVLRCLPLLPLAVWTLWFDRSRPLEHRPRLIRAGGRLVLLLGVMAFVVLVLGLGLNWLYDPSRVI